MMKIQVNTSSFKQDNADSYGNLRSKDSSGDWSNNEEESDSIDNLCQSLLIRYGSKYYNIEQNNIAYIYTREAVNVLVSVDGCRLPIHLPLSQLMKKLDPRSFSRMSMDLIVNIDSIKGLIRKRGARLYIDLKPDLGLDFVFDESYNGSPMAHMTLIDKMSES